MVAVIGASAAKRKCGIVYSILMTSLSSPEAVTLSFHALAGHLGRRESDHITITLSAHPFPGNGEPGCQTFGGPGSWRVWARRTRGLGGTAANIIDSGGHERAAF